MQVTDLKLSEKLQFGKHIHLKKPKRFKDELSNFKEQEIKAI